MPIFYTISRLLSGLLTIVNVLTVPIIGVVAYLAAYDEFGSMAKNNDVLILISLTAAIIAISLINGTIASITNHSRLHDGKKRTAKPKARPAASAATQQTAKKSSKKAASKKKAKKKLAPKKTTRKKAAKKKVVAKKAVTKKATAKKAAAKKAVAKKAVAKKAVAKKAAAKKQA